MRAHSCWEWQSTCQLMQHCLVATVRLNRVLNAQQCFAFFCYSWNWACRVPRFRCIKHPIVLESIWRIIATLLQINFLTPIYIVVIKIGKSLKQFFLKLYSYKRRPLINFHTFINEFKKNRQIVVCTNEKESFSRKKIKLDIGILNFFVLF